MVHALVLLMLKLILLNAYNNTCIKTKFGVPKPKLSDVASDTDLLIVFVVSVGDDKGELVILK